MSPLRSDLGSEKARHGSEAHSGEAPRSRADTGARFLQLGAGTRGAEPRAQAGKDQGQRLPAPRETGVTAPATSLANLEGSQSTAGAPFWREVPSPPRYSPPTPGPPDSPSPGYRWPAAPTSSAATATRSGAAAAPRRPPAPMAAGARGPDGSERAAPARGGHAPRRQPERRWGPRVLFFQARGPRITAPAREPPGISPGRGARPRPLQIRRRGPAEAAPTPSHCGPGPVRRSQGPEPRAAPWLPGSRPRARLCRDLRTRGQTDAQTDGRADGRAGTWAGGWRAGGGSEDCSARKQRGRQLGPVRAAGKGGADPDSEGTRRPGEAREGWREAAQREAPPRPVRRPPYSGPRAGGPGRALAEGRPRSPPGPSAPDSPASPVPEPGGAPDAGASETDPVFNSLLFCPSWTSGNSVCFLKNIT